MKKLVFFSIAILFAVKISAQDTTWCPQGATWYFKYSQSWYSQQIRKNGYVELKYTGDTTINSIACKKIIGKFSGCTYCHVSNPSVYPQVVIPNFRTHYTYENNGVIYLYNKNSSKFDTVVNFNANIGDKWLRPSGCGDVLTVTDTGHVSAYGLSLKQIKTSHTYTYVEYHDPFDHSDTSIVMGDNGNIFTERIFSTSSVPNDELFGASCYKWQPVGVFDEEPEQRAGFLCYQDNYTNVDGCSHIKLLDVGIKENNLNQINLSVYPNPTNEMLNVESPLSPKGGTIKIIDVLGKTVCNKQLVNQKTQINVSELQKGIYFIKIGNTVSKFVKE
ncbi:MAG: T9SS type A sorting domain-containing protein [Bacteroidetes bacterium]|nr:T9SS type A sorting domain-containing protein [Bacteroidota bacterium]